MKGILAAIAVAGAFATAGLAQDAMSADTMTCADFSAMDSAGQMEAIGSMETGDAGAEDTQSEDMATKALAACEAHPDMTVGEAMESMGG